MPRHVVLFCNSAAGPCYFYGRLLRLREPIPGYIELGDARVYKGPIPAKEEHVPLAFRLAAIGPVDSDQMSQSVPRLRLAEVAGEAILDVSPVAYAAWNGATTLDVMLVAPGHDKIHVIKVVRELTGLGLKEAKDLVEATLTAPQQVKRRLSAKDAKEAAKWLRGTGATVTIVPSPAGPT